MVYFWTYGQCMVTILRCVFLVNCCPKLKPFIASYFTTHNYQSENMAACYETFELLCSDGNCVFIFFFCIFFHSPHSLSCGFKAIFVEKVVRHVTLKWENHIHTSYFRLCMTLADNFYSVQFFEEKKTPSWLMEDLIWLKTSAQNKIPTFLINLPGKWMTGFSAPKFTSTPSKTLNCLGKNKQNAKLFHHMVFGDNTPRNVDPICHICHRPCI